MSNIILRADIQELKQEVLNVNKGLSEKENCI